MVLVSLTTVAWASPQVELGGGVRSPCPAVSYDDESLEGGATPALGLDVGVLPWTGPVAVRLGASVETWHARWTWAGETYSAGVDARGELRVALRLATARADRIAGLRPGPFATLDVGGGVAAVTGSLHRTSTTLSLRPALHLWVADVPLWLAVDLRAGTSNSAMYPQCISLPCPSLRFDPGGTGVAVVIGGTLPGHPAQ